MDWERTGRITGKIFLLFLEYFFKLSATVIGLIVLGANGQFGTKLATGFSSLSPALRQLFEAPGKIFNVATVINDYSTLTAARFNELYGGQAVHGVLSYLNEGIVYIQAVYHNLIYQPFATVFATGIAFFVLYLLGRVLRFARQKGRGSYFTRLERKLGSRVFEPKRDLIPKPPIPKRDQPQLKQPNVDRDYLYKKFDRGKIQPGFSAKN